MRPKKSIQEISELVGGPYDGLLVYSRGVGTVEMGNPTYCRFPCIYCRTERPSPEPDAATCYDFVRYVAEEIQGKKAD